MTDGAVAGTAGEVVAVAATGSEARPLRQRLRGLPGIRVELCGIGVSRPGTGSSAAMISCGLAGALDPSLPTGTVVVPDAVVDASGSVHACDAALVARLRDAAVRCGVEPAAAVLVTVDHVVTGPERTRWAGQGYAAVDMESAVLVRRSERFAAVRVVLDTPARELSATWEHPRRALARPWLWGEALWLARVAPPLCDLVARIVAEAFAAIPTGPTPGTSAPPARRAG